MSIGDVALAREAKVFFIEETTAGTLVEPTDTDLILTLNIPTVNQERDNFPDGQIRNTRSKLQSIAGRHLAGSWSFDTYIKPSGTAGVAPAEAPLLEGLLGAGTVDAGVSVTYAPSDTDPLSYSMWYLDGHTVFMCSGCGVDKATFNITGKDIPKIAWSGGLMKRLHTGTDTLGAAITDTTSTTITPSDIKKFSVGSIFTIGTERMKVATKGASTMTVTRGYGSTTPATHLISATMTPWLPTGTESGVIVHGRLGVCTKDAVNFDILTSEVSIANNIKYYEEEKNGQDYATEFGVPEDRMVDGKITLYFRKGDASRFQDNIDFNSIAFVIPVGTTAGSKCTINLPQNNIKSPNITGDAERIQELTLVPYATTAYNDEISIVYA